ncbi:MAG TPA: cyclic nucleotide-binding domain-containing protein, partial [Thermoanaerobaculia bacterium]
MAPQSDGCVRTIARLGTLQERQRDEVLFREGDEPRGIHILESGSVRLFHSVDGRSHSEVLDGEQILGLSAVVSGRPHETTAVAIGPCATRFVERERFLDCLRTNAEISFLVVQILSGNVT